jgi:hypothetical protein
MPAAMRHAIAAIVQSGRALRAARRARAIARSSILPHQTAGELDKRDLCMQALPDRSLPPPIFPLDTVPGHIAAHQLGRRHCASPNIRSMLYRLRSSVEIRRPLSLSKKPHTPKSIRPPEKSFLFFPTSQLGTKRQGEYFFKAGASIRHLTGRSVMRRLAFVVATAALFVVPTSVFSQSIQVGPGGGPSRRRPWSRRRPMR